MTTEEGKEIYRERAATSETVNADLRSCRGLTQLTVRGLEKITCVALWCAGIQPDALRSGVAELNSLQGTKPASRQSIADKPCRSNA